MRLVSLASLEDALLARVEEEICRHAGHRWHPVLGGGRWCAACCRYEERRIVKTVEGLPPELFSDRRP